MPLPVVAVAVISSAAGTLGTAAFGGVAALLRLDPFRPPDIPMQLPLGYFLRRRYESNARVLKLDYTKKINIAFIGRQKLGKSSMINAIRGLKNGDKDAVHVHPTLHTTEASPHEWENIVLWDIPGAESMECPMEKYFEKYCLYLFDVLVLFTKTLERSDIEFIKTAVQQDINFMVVQSMGDELISRFQRNNPEKSSEECAEMAITGFSEEMNEQLQRLDIRRYIDRFLICDDNIRKHQKNKCGEIEPHLKLLDDAAFIRRINGVTGQRRMRRQQLEQPKPRQKTERSALARDRDYLSLNDLSKT